MSRIVFCVLLVASLSGCKTLDRVIIDPLKKKAVETFSAPLENARLKHTSANAETENDTKEDQAPGWWVRLWPF